MKKKFKKKIVLNKQTIANLGVDKMKLVRGGWCRDEIDNDTDGWVDEPSEASCGMLCNYTRTVIDNFFRCETF